MWGGLYLKITLLWFSEDFSNLSLSTDLKPITELLPFNSNGWVMLENLFPYYQKTLSFHLISIFDIKVTNFELSKPIIIRRLIYINFTTYFNKYSYVFHSRISSKWICKVNFSLQLMIIWLQHSQICISKNKQCKHKITNI